MNNPIFSTDGYKPSHILMYPDGTQRVNSNFTPRSNKHAPMGFDGKPIDKVVSFSQQVSMRHIHEMFNTFFFSRDKEELMKDIRQEFLLYYGQPYDTTHFENLHDLGYLPLEVKALPEGTLVPMGVPLFVIENTLPESGVETFWLTNHLETLISQMLWKPITSATIAFEFRKMIEHFVHITDKDNMAAVDYMAHDFSARGMDVTSSVLSGMGHALSFKGSDTIPVIESVRHFYDAQGVIIQTVPASEHSVMCAGGKESEVETFRRIMKKKIPYWNFIYSFRYLGFLACFNSYSS